ncbi:phosphotransferase [Colwellia sp. MSW7]|uniref:Phosphotransferase n=1 Tax=Colwellia maritima TaxID=2912588 RepID=A0ABS9X9P4_9GAMM|nr:phosphotransferase [Colwellia maritima]MCI2286166.1 phosphotransferase [Colwellia maritima]
MNYIKNHRLLVSESRLSEETVGSIVAEHFQLPYYLNCEFFFRGCNDTYRLEADGRFYALRVYRYNWRSLEEIQSELSLLNHLSQTSDLVAQPIRPKNGTSIITLDAPEGRRFAVLFEWVSGYQPDYFNCEQAGVFGANMARLHQSLDKLSVLENRSDHGLDRLLHHPMEKLLSQESISVEDRKTLNLVALHLTQTLSENSLTSLSWGLCHGDAHAGNATICKDRLRFFDFDFCGPGRRLYDLATYCWAGMLRQPEDCRQAFLNGYLTHANHSEKFIELLKEFVMLRQLWFLGYEIDRQHIVGQGYLSRVFFSNHIGFLKHLMETTLSFEK